MEYLYVLGTMWLRRAHPPIDLRCGEGGRRDASNGSPVALGSTGTHEVSGEASDPTPRCNPTNGITNARKHNQVPLEGKREVPRTGALKLHILCFP